MTLRRGRWSRFCATQRTGKGSPLDVQFDPDFRHGASWRPGCGRAFASCAGFTTNHRLRRFWIAGRPERTGLDSALSHRIQPAFHRSGIGPDSVRIGLSSSAGGCQRRMEPPERGVIDLSDHRSDRSSGAPRNGLLRQFRSFCDSPLFGHFASDHDCDLQRCGRQRRQDRLAVYHGGNQWMRCLCCLRLVHAVSGWGWGDSQPRRRLGGDTGSRSSRGARWCWQCSSWPALNSWDGVRNTSTC